VNSSLPGRSALRQWELRFGPNMTPMVDIVMVILIFFMAGTALVGPEWVLRASLPDGRGAARPASTDPFSLPPARFELLLSVRDGRTVTAGLGLTNASPDDVGLALRRLASDAGNTEVILLIRPAPDVPYRDVVRIHDECERAGITRIGLMPSRAG
jgi:biopolymer transport protein ExbD